MEMKKSVNSPKFGAATPDLQTKEQNTPFMEKKAAVTLNESYRSSPKPSFQFQNISSSSVRNHNN